MNVFVNVKFRASRVAGKPGRVFYQLVCGGRVRQVASSVSLSEAEWEAVQRQNADPDDRTGRLKRRIEAEWLRLCRIVRELDAEMRPYMFCEIVRCFRSRSGDPSVLAFLDARIAQLAAEHRLSTARNYRRARTSFAVFLGDEDIPFDLLSERLIASYNAFLLRRGVVRNTVSFYMRILRAVYNRAVREGLTEQKYPFAEVYTGVDRTCKRAVDEAVIRRMRDADLAATPDLQLARDLFLFSFYTRGMAFVDVAHLRKKDLCGGELSYVRRKTGRRMLVRLEPCMREIIRRYEPLTDHTPYLFPLLTASEPVARDIQYRMALNAYNRWLGRLSERLGLEVKLTSYASRHSWATTARNLDIPIPVISVGMGHTSCRTTEIYLASLENTTVDRANRMLLAALG